MNEQKNGYEEQLALDVGGFAFDPLGFVLYAFPWGEGELAGMEGPEPWQAEELAEIANALHVGGEGAASEAIRSAIASGHGIGKSAFVAWIILWAMSTFKGARGVVTANTEAQLKGKTWAELAKWHRLCLCGHWFDCTATALIARLPGHDKTWRCDMVPWSERNTEAFAGLHNKGKRVLLIYDEASAIPDSIWDVSEGATTDDDTEIIWIVCGNPTRNTGKFRECFGRMKHRWRTRQVDSRTVSITNKKQLQEWVDDYGEDSDFVRIRVRGVFPRAGSNQLIEQDIVDAAFDKSMQLEMYKHAPRVLGVDVARFGDDQSVLVLRQGLACLKIRKFRGLDLMDYAGIVAKFIHEEGPETTFVDQGGLGAGVVDRLRQLGIRSVIGVDFGGTPIDKALYVNKRTEMWCLMRDWLRGGAAIPPDEELRTDLTGPEYGFTGDKGQMVLEKKKDMKKRGLSSPDCGDALALTFAAPVRPSRARDGSMDVLASRRRRATQKTSLYND